MDDDVSLPRATLAKIMKESMPPSIRVSSELIDLLLECCTEFVHMIYSQANEVCTHEKRSTILPDHIVQALQQLDFSEWIPEVKKAWDEHKVTSKGVTKAEKLASASTDLTEEELCALQQKMLAEAASRSLQFSDDPLSVTPSGAQLEAGDVDQFE